MKRWVVWCYRTKPGNTAFKFISATFIKMPGLIVFSEINESRVGPPAIYFDCTKDDKKINLNFSL